MILSEAVSQKFQALLSKIDSWKNLVESQFVKHLSVFVGWTVEDADFKVERAHQEGFLDSALNRSSILAHGEGKEYVPQKPIPATGKAKITNNSEVGFALPRGMEFQSDEQVIYTLSSSVTVSAKGTVEVSFSQQSKEESTYIVDEEKEFYEILFTRDETPKIYSFSVAVSEDGSGETWESYKYDRLLVNSYSDDRVYDEFYHFTDQIGLRFGNGDFGKILPLNAIVKVTKILTEGESMLLAGSSLWPMQEITAQDGTVADYTVEVSETIQNGEAQESTEKTRKMLHYAPVYNEKLIWDNDYNYFLKRRFPDIVFAVAWGEEESERMWGINISHVNEIWVSAYSPEREIKDVAMGAIKEVSFLCRNFKWHNVEHLKFTVSVTGKVLEDCILSEVVQAIKDKLTDSYGVASQNRRDSVLIHEVYNDIQDTGYFDRSSGAWFSVQISGNYEAEYLYQMISIDISASTFVISYINE